MRISKRMAAALAIAAVGGVGGSQFFTPGPGRRPTARTAHQH